MKAGLTTSMQNIDEKYNALAGMIKAYGNSLVAFSGGVDSTFLLKVCSDVLGEKTLAVTAVSPAYTREEIQEAKEMAKTMKVEHLLIETNEIQNENYAGNPWNRCYFCKTELFQHLEPIARERKISHILYGENYSDVQDIRPGAQAAKEFGVYAPLRDARLTKEEIRILSRGLGLPTYDKPQNACLASRIAFGEAITQEKLARVAEAERFLHALGFLQVRVRSHDRLARIEIDKEDMDKFTDASLREKIYKKFREIGFAYTALDLLGYRTGSSNESILREKAVPFKGDA